MKYGKVLTSSKRRISRADQGEAGRKRVRIGNRNPTLPLCTLISCSKATTVQTLGSGHEGAGLSESNLTVRTIKPVGVLMQSHVFMIK